MNDYSRRLSGLYLEQCFNLMKDILTSARLTYCYSKSKSKLRCHYKIIYINQHWIRWFPPTAEGSKATRSLSLYEPLTVSQNIWLTFISVIIQLNCTKIMHKNSYLEFYFIFQINSQMYNSYKSQCYLNTKEYLRRV